MIFFKNDTLTAGSQAEGRGFEPVAGFTVSPLGMRGLIGSSVGGLRSNRNTHV